MILKDLPQRVKIIEVGARDGLQSEVEQLSVATRVEFIDLLSATGLSVIEVGSFVSPKWIPQMQDSNQVYETINKAEGVSYPMLVPNLKGLDEALAVNVQEIAIFTAASETFAQKNINCSIKESLSRYEKVFEQLPANMKVRGYVSCVHGCPYEGKVDLRKVSDVVEALFQLGCYEISLGDTIGVGTAKQTEALLEATQSIVPIEKLAVHFHDTYGQALSNCLIALQCGVTNFDSSVAGLGGCPYAKGAAGNLATEDLLFMLAGLGIETGIDTKKLIQASHFICNQLKHLPRSKVALASWEGA